MSTSIAEKLVADAMAFGAVLKPEGERLRCRFATTPPESFITELKEHKAEIIALLTRPAGRAWDAQDWQAFLGERAGIAEFGGGLPRPEAEARAFACCIAQWLNRNPVRSSTGRCLGCGDTERAGDTVLPFGTESNGHAWLHSRCWPAWHAGRRAEAVAALAAMGITIPPEFPNDFGKNRGA